MTTVSLKPVLPARRAPVRLYALLGTIFVLAVTVITVAEARFGLLNEAMAATAGLNADGAVIGP